MSEPGDESPQDPSVAPRAGRARHRRRPRRRRRLPILVTLAVLATTIFALAGTGAGSYLARLSGIDFDGMRTRFEQLVEQFRAQEFAQVDQGSHAAFCRIGDPGSSTVAQLQPPRFCSIGDRNSRSLDELTHPTMCMIGDPGTVELARLLGQDDKIAWNDDGGIVGPSELFGRKLADNGPSGLTDPDPGTNPDIVPTSNRPPGGGHPFFPPPTRTVGPDPDPTDPTIFPLPNPPQISPPNFTNPGGGNKGGKGGDKGGKGGDGPTGDGGGPPKNQDKPITTNQPLSELIVVPEPSAITLFAVGLGGLAVLRRRVGRG
jgi:hypothetical protein